MSCWQDEIHLLGNCFKKLFVKWALSPQSGENFLRTLENLLKFAKTMDVRDGMPIIHSCYAAGWEKYQCHLPGSEEHLLIYQGKQLCNDKKTLSVLVNLKLIVRCF